MKKTEIILPKRIAVLREQPNQDIKVKNEELSLYFNNFIHPMYPWQDIVVECEYGRNMGHCWRINEYPQDISEFDLTIKVYDEEGILVTEKKTVIELFDQEMKKPFKIVCVGDSLTHHMIYVSHMQNRLKKVISCGTRSYDGHNFGEGRGGWQYKHYFEKHSLKKGERGATNWVSPFLFPKGIEGKEYFGDMEYYEASQEENRSTCCFNGFEFAEIKEGQFYHKHGKLYKYGVKEPVQESVQWEFSFKKYLEKNDITNLNAVSLLFGANDIAPYEYEITKEAVNRYIDNTKRFIKEVKATDESIDVIINLPVLGSDQSAFGKVLGCSGTYKAHAHNMREGAKALLKEFEGVEGVYICPMLHVLDTENGFDKARIRANLYNDNQIIIKNDGVHPNANGYRQMGDALAAVVEKLRKKEGKLNERCIKSKKL